MAIYDVNGNTIRGLEESYINVADYGADITGAENSSTAIQSALAAGKTVFFPAGTYLLTDILYVPSNRHLVFEPGATLKRGASITVMMTNEGDATVAEYNGISDVIIEGATFDCNASSYSTNCTPLAFIHAQRVKVIGCRFINHTTSWHCIEYSACKDSVIDGCYFDDSANTSETIQIESPYNAGAWPWSNGAIDNTPSIYIDVRNCTFVGGATGVGYHGSGSASYVAIHNNVFKGYTSYAVNFYNNSNIYVHDNVINDFEGSTAIYSAHIAWNNMIDGTLT